MRYLRPLRCCTTRTSFLALAAAFAATSAATPARAAMLIPIGDVPAIEQRPTLQPPPVANVSGISGDGSTVIGRLETGLFQGAFRWTRSTGFTPIGDLWQTVEGGAYSWVHAVSDDGKIIVGSSNVDRLPTNPDHNQPAYIPPKRVAMRWSAEDGLTQLVEPIGGSLASEAYGISADGTTIVGYSGPGAARWTHNGTQRYVRPLYGGEGLVATDVSADGNVVLGTSQYGTAVIWRADGSWGPIGLSPSAPGVPGSAGTTGTAGTTPTGGKWGQLTAQAISADGTTVVGSLNSDAGTHAIRWTRAGGIEFLDQALGGYGQFQAVDVSADGSVVLLQSQLGDAAGTVFLWSEYGGLTSIRELLAEHDVDTTGWTFEQAVGISNDGQVIVGNGRLDSRNVGWLVDLSTNDTVLLHTPEPSAAILAWIAAVALILARRRS